MTNRKYRDKVKVLWGNKVSLHLYCLVIIVVVIINAGWYHRKQRNTFNHKTNRRIKQIEIIITTPSSFLRSLSPCRGSFDLLLSCQDPSLYPSAPVHALWRLMFQKNDEYLLLLVTSNVSKSRNKALQYGNTRCFSYIYTTNILTTETATGYRPATPCWVWKLYLVFFVFYFQSPALESERFKIQRPILIVLLKTKVMNCCIRIAIE